MDKLDKKMDQMIEMLKRLPSIETDIHGISKTIKEHQRSIEYTQEEVEDLKTRMITNEENTKLLQQEVLQSRAETEKNKADMQKLQDELRCL